MTRPWAEHVKRVFEIDVLTCPWCGEKRKLIALITDGIVVRKMLDHLGLPTERTGPRVGEPVNAVLGLLSGKNRTKWLSGASSEASAATARVPHRFGLDSC